MGTDSFTLTIGGNDPATATADKAGIFLLLSSWCVSSTDFNGNVIGYCSSKFHGSFYCEAETTKYPCMMDEFLTRVVDDINIHSQTTERNSGGTYQV